MSSTGATRKVASSGTRREGAAVCAGCADAGTITTYYGCMDRKFNKPYPTVCSTCVLKLTALLDRSLILIKIKRIKF